MFLLSASKLFQAAKAAVVPCLLGLSISVACAQETNQTFPGLVKNSNKNVSRGQTTLPFLVSMAHRPELLDPRYLSFVLGPPDKAKPYAYPCNSFCWSPADGSQTKFYLDRGIDSQTAGGRETRQLVANFSHSSLRLKSVTSKLGKPDRRYYDNRAQLVELYQITPETTLMVSELPNTFDVSQLSVRYQGAYLPRVSQEELAQAENYRLTAIHHHLSSGNRDRGFALLQAHVSDNPRDIEGHLQLARTLRNRCDINSAINEYRTALSLAQAEGDVTLQKEAINGLKPFGVLPANIAIVRAQSLKDAAGQLQ